MIALSEDQDDTNSKIRDWLRSRGGGDIIAGRMDASTGRKLHKFVKARFGPIPTTIFIGYDGRVRHVTVGGQNAYYFTSVGKSIAPPQP